MRNALPIALTWLVLPFGCGDNNTKLVDARQDGTIAADPDASTEPGCCDFESFEGGEVRYEYIRYAPGQPNVDRTRLVSYFFKGTPVHYPFPAVPGCTRYTADPPTMWPVAQDPNRQYLDPGHVIVTAANGAGYGAGDPTGATPPIPLDIAPGNTTPGMNKDMLGRAHTGPWFYSILNDVKNTYSHDNTAYNVQLTGSDEWPAQAFNNAIYIPGYFSLISPAEDVSPVPLPADQDMTFQFGEPASQPGLPPGAEVSTVIAFTNGSLATLVCVLDNTNGTMTIPKDDINFIRATVPGGARILRQNVVHQLRELTDGVTHENRRVDFLTVWCWNYPFSVP